MKKLLVILLFVISKNIGANNDLFKEGNDLYLNGNYAEAILKYNSILLNNIETYEIYYNLGNCYYKTEDLANAIWHYEKSLKIERNEKTIQNLAIVNLKTIDKIEPLPQLFYKKWLTSISKSSNTKSWQILALICIWSILLLRTLIFPNSSKKNSISNILLFLAILFLFIANFSYKSVIEKKEGIIFSSSLIVNSAPVDNSTNLFSLHSGTKIEIIDEIKNWINIRLSDGRSGWIEKENCKVLY